MAEQTRLRWLSLVGLVLLLAFALPARSCHAQFTARDGQIIARTLSFIEPSINGSMEIGIVYAPDRPASVSLAESMRSAIGDALIAGKVTLKSHLVPVDQLSSATGLGGIFIAGDLGSHLDEVTAAAQRLHIPTISNELACVRAGRCILAYSSQPSVEIVLNHEAANSAGVHFSQAFRMLVREL